MGSDTWIHVVRQPSGDALRMPWPLGEASAAFLAGHLKHLNNSARTRRPNEMAQTALAKTPRSRNAGVSRVGARISNPIQARIWSPGRKTWPACETQNVLVSKVGPQIPFKMGAQSWVNIITNWLDQIDHNLLGVST